MRVFLTGGSGLIGQATLKSLVAAGHEVIALVRSDSSAALVSELGATPFSGELNLNADQLKELPNLDGFIHLAATFGDDMAEKDRLFVEAADAYARQANHPVKMVYTGGCWLYGDTGGKAAAEGSQFDPLEDFAFMLDQRDFLFFKSHLQACLVHPGLVWHESGGTISRFLEEAQAAQPIRIIGNAQTRWPMVHRDDLAQLYRMAVEQGQHGMDYHGVSENGVTAGTIAKAINSHTGNIQDPKILSTEDAVTEMGSWAAGYALDQMLESRNSREKLGWHPQKTPILEHFAKQE